MGSPSPLSSYLSFSLLLLLATAILFSDIAVAGRPRFSLRRPNIGVAFMCKRTDYPSVCLATLKNKRVTDVRSATATSIQASISTAMKARAYATQLIGSRSQSGAAKASLKACKSHYSDAIGDLQTSLRNLAARDKGSLMSNLSAGLADVAACDDEFANPRTSPLAKYSATLDKLTSNNLALASKV